MVSDALDYRSPAVDSMAAGNGQFLYLGWIYPHLARRSSDRGARAHHPRAKSGGVAMRVRCTAPRAALKMRADGQSCQRFRFGRS